MNPSKRFHEIVAFQLSFILRRPLLTFSSVLFVVLMAYLGSLIGDRWRTLSKIRVGGGELVCEYAPWVKHRLGIEMDSYITASGDAGFANSFDAVMENIPFLAEPRAVSIRDIQEHQLEALQACVSLQSLAIVSQEPTIRADDVVFLDKMVRLETLILNLKPSKHDGQLLRHISHLSALRVLQISGATFDEDEIMNVVESMPHLEILCVSGLHDTRQTREWIHHMPNIKCVILDGEIRLRSDLLFP